MLSRGTDGPFVSCIAAARAMMRPSPSPMCVTAHGCVAGRATALLRGNWRLVTGKLAYTRPILCHDAQETRFPLPETRVRWIFALLGADRIDASVVAVTTLSSPRLFSRVGAATQTPTGISPFLVRNSIPLARFDLLPYRIAGRVLANRMHLVVARRTQGRGDN